MCKILNDSRIPLAKITAAAKIAQSETEPDEDECILANLIHANYVRGYIAHQRRILVIAKENPFPPMASVAE